MKQLILSYSVLTLASAVWQDRFTRDGVNRMSAGKKSQPRIFRVSKRTCWKHWPMQYCVWATRLISSPLSLRKLHFPQIHSDEELKYSEFLSKKKLMSGLAFDLFWLCNTFMDNNLALLF
jgi:hypothetical protein